MWLQREISLSARARGFHLITNDVFAQIPEVAELSVGLLHILVKHTSASLTINENASPDVLHDFEAQFNEMVPERQPFYNHTLEGDDDMPAHIKASMLGVSLTIPIKDGRPNLGTWQGIFLCEHRNRGNSRHLVLTLQGE